MGRPTVALYLKRDRKEHGVMSAPPAPPMILRPDHRVYLPRDQAMTASFKLRSLTRESWTCPIRDSRYVSTLFAGCRCSTQNAGSFMPNRPFARPQQGLTRRGANYTHRLALSKRRRSPRRAAPTVLTDARLLSTEPSRSHSCLRGSREDTLGLLTDVESMPNSISRVLMG
jgi:hypothetical protein